MLQSSREKKYKLIIVTSIPCKRIADGYLSLDLWVRDLESQLLVVDELCIICPMAERLPDRSTMIPSAVRVVSYDELAESGQIGRLIRRYDVIQVGANAPCWARSSKTTMGVVKSARGSGKRVILTISSNRAKTTLLNAAHTRLGKKILARLTSASITRNQNRLMRLADGINIVGHGLMRLIPSRYRKTKDIHVDTASWIKESEIITDDRFSRRIADARLPPSPSLCIAARLERMKGVHLGIEALRLLRKKRPENLPSLAILGKGPELERLQALASAYDLDDHVSFPGTFPYPDDFFAEIGKHAILLVTNLNDEQPRVIFDALSQGLVPICPDSTPYRSLGLDDRVLYSCGDEGALAETIARFYDHEFLVRALEDLRKLTKAHTIDKMHLLRAGWIAGIPRRRDAPAPRSTP